MSFIECTDYVYDKIENNRNLRFLIGHNQRQIDNILLYNLFTEEVWDVCEKAKNLLKEPGKVSLQAIQRAKKILELENILNDHHGGHIDDDEIIKMLGKSGLLTFVVLKSFEVDSVKLGFGSDAELDAGIAAYCISMKHRYDDFIWRYKNFKNTLSNSWHGDLHFRQENISANLRREKGLFDIIEIYDIYKTDKDTFSTGFSFLFSNWGALLRTILGFIDHLGLKDADFVKNWKEYFDKNIGTATTESMCGGSGRYEDLIMHLFAEWCNIPVIKEKGEEPKTKYTTMQFGDANRLVSPFIFNDILCIGYKTDDSPDAVLNRTPVKGVIQYEPEELPKLLEGTLIKYARDRREAMEIMEHFMHDKYRDFLDRLERFCDKK